MRLYKDLIMYYYIGKCDPNPQTVIVLKGDLSIIP